ncbi:phosphate acetyltransferase [Candidatus Woesearchaeota archaeon]|nr:phosphate acetyltransferase [Candidatus Woesearchaeota archaeon]
MSDVIGVIKEKAKARVQRLVFPEAEDGRVLKACAQVASEGFATPFLIGDQAAIRGKASASGVALDGIEVRDPAHDEHVDAYVAELVKLRQHKGVDDAKARELLQDRKYFAAMMVHMGHADGCVTGATHPTAETIRPAVQVIGMQEGFKISSSYFLMLRGEGKLFFADSAFVIDPSPEELADIAIATHDSAKTYGVEPKVAMLSFSTKGSAKHEMVDKVTQATALVKERRDDIVVDGELQFDAAYMEKVGAKKAPGSPVAGKANVFIFPNLDSGNICYKVAQRLGGYEAIGPIIQGLQKPMNDLSRGCSAEDIVSVAAITAVQAQQ